jgi:hypothetical protein
VTGIDRDGADFSTELFDVQCKLRQGQPGYLRAWLNGICGYAKPRNRIGIVIWKETGRGRPDGDALVVLKLSDWVALHGNPPAPVEFDAQSS